MRQLRNVVLLAVGSGGDVAPFVSIGNAFARRGISTTLLGPARYESYASGCNLVYESIGAEDVFDAVFNGDDVWHPTRGLGASWRYYAAAMRSAYERVVRQFNPDETAVVSSSFAVGARALESLAGFQNATVHLSPAVIFSHVEPPRWPKHSIPSHWPSWLKRFLARSAERFAVDPTIRHALADPAQHLKLDLPPHLFSSWIHSSSRVYYAFPNWFCAGVADWPKNGMHVGFPLGAGLSGRIPDAVDEFIRRDKRRLAVVTAGTAVRSSPHWVQGVCSTLIRNGWKILIVGREGVAGDFGFLNSDLLACSHVPFTELFKRTELVIHHGGVGTLGEALRAGIPQVIYPQAHDQPENAAQIERLGAGLDGSRFKIPSDLYAMLTLRLADLSRVAQELKLRLSAERSAEERIVDQTLSDWGRRLAHRAFV